MDLTPFIRDVPNFPKPGIIFKDITPLLGNHQALSYAVEAIAKMTITPRPDSELRLFMMFQRVPEPVACGAPAVPMVKRTGFTAVEWGGVNLDEQR